MRLFSIILISLFIFTLSGYTKTINVPADYSKIQDAIDAAVNGDTVLVQPGTYVETIDYKGKAITVKSSHGAAMTMIDGMQAGVSVVTFRTGEGSASVLENFTIINGYAGYGGGIHCNQTSPVITKCRILSNRADYDGGGIWCNDGAAPAISSCTIMGNTALLYDGGGIYCYYNSVPVITGCSIRLNTAYYHGGGIYCDEGPLLTIKNCDISENWVNYGVGGGIGCFDSMLILVNTRVSDNIAYKHGGAVYCYDCTSILANCTLIRNTANYLSGGIACDKTDFHIANTILRGSSAATGPEIWIGSTPSSVTISYSNLEGGKSSVQVDPGAALNWGAGMIDANPLFVDELNGDYHLTYQSPCRDGGDNSAVLDMNDFEGDPRIAYGTVDIGADEFYTHMYYAGDATPGGIISLKFVGPPLTTPVGFFIGTGVLDPPLPSMWGDWYLKFPVMGPLMLLPIPGNGVEVFSGALPAVPPAPYTIPMQALIGNTLTNLCLLEVE